MEEVERLRVREKKLQEAIEIWKKKHEQQQKIIKAMTAWISEQDIDEAICKKESKNTICKTGYITWEEGKKLCQDCIINYFESEVKEHE